MLNQTGVLPLKNPKTYVTSFSLAYMYSTTAESFGTMRATQTLKGPTLYDPFP